MAESRIVAIIQARLNSSRLPGKVMLEIAGQPMLCHVVERTRMASRVDEVVVATTTDPGDQVIEDLCRKKRYACYRGSEFDVLDRYYQAARQYQADVIVRITADCPLIDSEVVDQAVGALQNFLDRHSYDDKPAFVANRLPPPWGRTYPIGLDTEVCTFAMLEQAWKEASLPHQREHVMPFFYDHPEKFQVIHLNYERDLGDLRWTVDTAEDLELVRRVFSRFPGRENFSWLEVLDLFEREPSLSTINAQIPAKHYRQVDDRQIPS